MTGKMFSFLMAAVFLAFFTSCGSKAPRKAESSEPESVKEPASEAAEAEPAEKEESTASAAAGGQNLILTGSFEGSTDGWNIYLEGGAAEFGAKDGEMNLDITDVGRVDYGVQLYYDGFSVYENGVYEMSFDVSSTIPRTIEWRIQLNGGDYHAYVSEKITIGPETQHISRTFTMAEPTDLAPRLCMNCGVSEGYNAENAAHTIRFDNVSLCLTDGSGIAAEELSEGPSIRLNQVGYRKNMTKIAVAAGVKEAGSFSVIPANGIKAVFTGTASAPQHNASSDEDVQLLDFSEFKEEGRYYIRLDDGTVSPAFNITDTAYDSLTDAALHYFELAECGTAVEDDTFGHGPCHTGKARIYGTDLLIDVTGGWHDAGDYGRYIVAGAKAAADLLLAREDYGDERILDIVRYELDWMLKMQDPETGGVYHKVTCANFPGFVMPEEETEELIVLPVSTTATGTFTAVMAMAAEDYAEADPAFADTCLAAAKKAQAYLDSVPSDTAGFRNPSDVVTGEYGDTDDTDERFWALAQLYRTTGEASYLDKAAKYMEAGLAGDLGWTDTSLYGYYAIAKAGYDSNNLAEAAKGFIRGKADDFIGKMSGDAYGSALGGDYIWGSNMVAANRGMAMLMAAQFSEDQRYIRGAEQQLSYLLGTNATGYCFVTGFGETSPLHPHHRPSVAKGIAQPGMLVGGPDSALEDPTAQGYLGGAAPAACFIDNDQSYSTNEVTIYWNSPLVYLIKGLPL